MRPWIKSVYTSVAVSRFYWPTAKANSDSIVADGFVDVGPRRKNRLVSAASLALLSWLITAVDGVPISGGPGFDRYVDQHSNRLINLTMLRDRQVIVKSVQLGF